MGSFLQKYECLSASSDTYRDGLHCNITFSVRCFGISFNIYHQTLKSKTTTVLSRIWSAAVRILQKFNIPEVKIYSNYEIIPRDHCECRCFGFDHEIDCGDVSYIQKINQKR